MRHDSAIAAVTFDMDGLMLNTEDVYREVGTELCTRRGKTFDDDLRHTMMGQPAPVSLAILIEWHKLTDTVEGLRAEVDEIFWAKVFDRLAPMPGLLDLLDQLEAHQIPKGVATSGDRRYAHTLLDHVGVRQRFQFVLTADDVTHGKPHPEIYLKAATNLGVAPAAMLVLEDSANGCKAAVAAGAFTIAVPSEHSADHTFDGARFVADGLVDPRIPRCLGFAP